MLKTLVRIIGCILLVSLSFTALKAQEPGSRRFRKLIRKADAWLQARYYDQALLLYQEILKKDPNNQELTFKVGIAYYENQQEEEALAYFRKLYRMNKKYHPMLDFYMAEAYHYTASIDRALMHYNFTRQNIAQKEGKDTVYLAHEEMMVPIFRELLDKRVAECNFASQYIKDSLLVQVKNMGATINSKDIDYAPIISVNDSTLLFTSRRKGNTGGKKDPIDRHPYEDIYITYKTDSKWSAPKQLSQSINTNFHDASLGFSPDGKMLFLYRKGDIFVSNLQTNGKWGKPKPLKGKINSKFQETSFSISPDGQTIYFSSNRPGGYGGFDLYSTQLQANNTWGKPANLGATVNTKYDEDTPFISPDGKTLYFSSAGHSTMGKHDIFESVWLGQDWSKPRNLGYPINSTGDDICFILTADGQTAYYASDRKKGGLGRLDLYSVSKPAPYVIAGIPLNLINTELETYIATSKEQVDVTLYQRPVLTIRGTIRDKDNGRPLQNARIVLVDLETNREVSVFDNLSDTLSQNNYIGTIDSTGKYILHVTRKGYMYHNEYMRVPTLIRAKEEVLNMTLKKLERSQRVYVVVFFDYKSDDIKKEHEKDLEKLVSYLISNPDVNLVLNGHADQTGTDQRNQKLSADRARKVMEYLIGRDINPNRVTYKAWGESKLIDKRDDEAGRARNRRVECEITRNEAGASQY